MRDEIITCPLRIALCIVLSGLITSAATAAPKLHEFEYTVNISDPATTTEALAEGLGTTITALREWSRINKRRYALTDQLTTRGIHHLLSADERSEIFSDEDPAVNWQQFSTRFPDAAGIIRVSRPGLDDAAGSAILYLEFECGAQCGSGRLVNLVLTEGGQWQVTTGTLVWITSPE